MLPLSIDRSIAGFEVTYLMNSPAHSLFLLVVGTEKVQPPIQPRPARSGVSPGVCVQAHFPAVFDSRGSLIWLPNGASMSAMA